MTTQPVRDTPDKTDTDWLAYCPDGYGYGYGYYQSLAAVAPFFDLPVYGGSKKITLIEHIGDAETGLMGWEVDELVRKEVLELDAERIEDLRHHAAKSKTASRTAYDMGEVVDSYEPEPDAGDE